MAQVELAELSKYFKIDPNSDNGYNRTITDDQEHSFNLKSASFGLQYTKPGTGLTAYGSIGYSERAPTSNEMYTSGAWLKQSFLANPHLQPEKIFPCSSA